MPTAPPDSVTGLNRQLGVVVPEPHWERVHLDNVPLVLPGLLRNNARPPPP